MTALDKVQQPEKRVSWPGFLLCTSLHVGPEKASVSCVLEKAKVSRP